jgi:hypothetical protein
MKNTSVPGRASTAADLVNGDAAEAGPIIASGIVIVRRTVQSVGAVGVGPIIVRSMVNGEGVERGTENIVLETEKGREHVSVRRNLSLLSCYHVLATSSLLRRDPHLLGCEYLLYLKHLFETLERLSL